MKTVTINKMKVKIFEEDELREKLKIEKEDIDIILKYQRIFPELLQSDVNDFCINARNLHNNLVNGAKGIKMINGKEKIIKGTRFNDWINKRIKKYNFIENKDFKIYYNYDNNRFTLEEVINMSEQKRSSYGITKEYKLTLDMAILLCDKERYAINNIELLKFLYLFKDKNIKVIIKNNKRPEINFLDKLEQSLIPFNIEGIRQYSINSGKYRIDYYIPKLNIAIEYDELQHNTEINKEKDLIRQKEIECELACKFIRVSIKDSDEYNIGFVIKNIFNL